MSDDKGDELSRKDIRVLLKKFGVNADEAIVAHLARNPGVDKFKVRVRLEDLTDYGSQTAEGILELDLESEIRQDHQV